MQTPPWDPRLSRPFTTTTALELGVTLAQLRSRRFQRIFRGVYAPSSLVVTPTIRMLAALAWAGPPSAIAAWSSLRLQGVHLPIDAPDEDTIHLLKRRGTSCRGPEGIVVHTTRREFRSVESKTIEGLFHTDRPGSWVSLAMAGASIYQLVVVGDALMPRKGSAIDVPMLRRRVEAFGLFTGLRNARTALRLIRPGTESAMETHLRLLLLAATLPEPRVGYPLADDDGMPRAFLDLAHPDFRIDLEYDGDEFHSSKADRRADANRDRMSATFGYITLRFNGSVLWDPDPAIADVRRALVARGWDGRPTDFPWTREELGIPVYGQASATALSAGFSALNPAESAVALGASRRRRAP